MRCKDDINIPTFDIRIDELPQTKRFPLQMQISMSKFISIGIEHLARKNGKSPFDYIRDYLFKCFSSLIFGECEDEPAESNTSSNPKSLKARLFNELYGTQIRANFKGVDYDFDHYVVVERTTVRTPSSIGDQGEARMELVMDFGSYMKAKKMAQGRDVETFFAEAVKNLIHMGENGVFLPISHFDLEKLESIADDKETTVEAFISSLVSNELDYWHEVASDKEVKPVFAREVEGVF